LPELESADHKKRFAIRLRKLSVEVPHAREEWRG
jgi:hypothetical protein